jgi:sterol 3beta-glucosyltransferase
MIEHHSHRVRIATHGEFKTFVLNANKQLAGKVGKGGIKLEGRLLFFDAGGDPRDLMNYMVKSKCQS